MSDRAFAYVDSSGTRRLPIHDASHVRNALARFGQVRFETDAARERARARLLQAARRFRIVPVGFIVNEIDAATRAATNRADAAEWLRHDADDRRGGFDPARAGVGRRRFRHADRRAVGRAPRRGRRSASGIEVEARADEFFAVFESPRSAVDAAVAVQHALERALVRRRRRSSACASASTAATPRRPPTTTSVSTSTSRRGSRPLGHGGQIVASANTREAVRSTTGSSVRFVALGEHRLRGLSEPMPLFQVASPGLPSKFPPLRT